MLLTQKSTSSKNRSRTKYFHLPRVEIFSTRQVMINVCLPRKSQLARNKEAQHILMFSFEKVRYYYRICIIRKCSILRKSSSCLRFLNQSGVIDTFFSGMAIALHAFFLKMSHRQLQKNPHPLLHKKIQQKKSSIFAGDYSNFCHYFCCFFCFVKSHFLGRSLRML